jgi:biotin--[acetyl-coA-carboxylase] ligase
MKILRLESTGSTNTYVRERLGELEIPTLVWARGQTAGRGQRGNSWEAEPGKNLTCSVALRPSTVPARRQFSVSEGVALAVSDLLEEIWGIVAKVKWPNDIYVADRKIAGILIENAVMGESLLHSVAGIGLNVNQEQFLSDAPNPVSVKQLTGRSTPVEEVVLRLSAAIERRMSQCETPEGRERLHGEYMSRLWRGDGGLYRWRDTASGEEFEAAILSVAQMGHLTLRTADGDERTFAFKEVEARI